MSAPGAAAVLPTAAALPALSAEAAGPLDTTAEGAAAAVLPAPAGEAQGTPAAAQEGQLPAVPGSSSAACEAVGFSGSTSCSLGTADLLAVDAIEAQWRAQQSRLSSLGKRGRASLAGVEFAK